MVRAFVPCPLLPRDPPLRLDGKLDELRREAMAATERLNLATNMVPNPSWFLYGFVRKEAVISSQLEGNQATSAAWMMSRFRVGSGRSIRKSTY